MHKRDRMLKLVRLNGQLIKCMNKVFRDDREIFLTAALNYPSEELVEDGIFIRKSKYIDDREVILALVKTNGIFLAYASSAFRSDREIVLTAVSNYGGAMEYTYPKLIGDYEIVLTALQNDGLVLEYVMDELRASPEIILQAVINEGYALHYVRDADSKTVLAAVTSKNPNGSLRNAPSKFRNNREIVFAAVKNEGMALEYASAELRADREIVTAAVKNKGSALEYAHVEFKSDREIVLEAVKNDGMALKYASLNFQADREIIKEAITNNGMAIIYVWSGWLNVDREILLQAVIHDIWIFKYSGIIFNGYVELVLAIIENDGAALERADEDLEVDRPIISTAFKNIKRKIAYEVELKKSNEEIFISIMMDKSKTSRERYIQEHVETLYYVRRMP